MNKQDIIDRTRDYIRENFMYARPGVTVGEDDNLLTKGIVDSMGMVELITFLQDEFGTQPQDDEITEENFATLNRIASYVMRKNGLASVEAA